MSLQVPLSIDSLRQTAVWSGWGTSLAWWGNAIGRWPPGPERRALLEALFHPIRGLGLTVLRYNIGGGENPDHHHMRRYADVPGFLSADGEWDGEADAAQVGVLQQAQALGVDTVEAFSNSPPYWMARHPCAAGAPDGSGNLADGRLEEFADYLVRVVAHFREAKGITFQSLSPMNEPMSWWWKAGNNQEGCRFEVAQQKVLWGLLHQKLSLAGLGSVLLAGPEENDLDQNLETLKSLGPGGTAFLGRANVHSYQGTRRAELRAWAKTRGLPVWMSEVTVGGTAGHNHDDWTSGLELGEKIVADLNGLAPEAWVYWQAVEDEAGNHNHGLIHADFGDSLTWHRTKQYAVMAQFSRAIRPGSKLLDTGTSVAVAAWHQETGTVSVVAVNATDRPWSLTFGGDLSPLLSSGISGSRTSAHESMAPLSLQPTTGSVVAVASSVTTWQWTAH